MRTKKPLRAQEYKPLIKGNSLISHDTSMRFLPLIIAVMVFLILSVLGLVLALNTKTNEWARVLSGTLTIQIQPNSEGEFPEEAVSGIPNILAGREGIVSFRELSRTEVEALLSSWLGEGAIDPDIPLPKVYDVRVDPDVLADTGDLVDEIRALGDKVIVDDHRQWLFKVMNVVERFQWIGIIAGVLVLLSGAFVIIISTKTAMAVHDQVVEVLHLIGARDIFIAFQFARKILVLAAFGGFLGSLLAFGIYTILSVALKDLPFLSVGEFFVTDRQWLFLAGVPVALALLAMGVSAMTVLQSLKRMDR